jgi:hypothetical protein
MIFAANTTVWGTLFKGHLPLCYGTRARTRNVSGTASIVPPIAFGHSGDPADFALGAKIWANAGLFWQVKQHLPAIDSA